MTAVDAIYQLGRSRAWWSSGSIKSNTVGISMLGMVEPTAFN
jgi:hypothetical protein